MRTYTDKVVKRHLPRTELSRAERRQSERETAKKQKTYTLTQAQLDQKLKAVEMQATKKAFVMMMGFPLLTLRDKFGFGKERLNRFMDKMMDLYEAYEMDYVDLADLDRTIMEETGVTLLKKREGSIEMKFKVGDKVRIRKDLISGTWFRDCLVTRDMCEMGGKEAVIEKAFSYYYRLSVDNLRFSWTDEMLEPANEEEIEKSAPVLAKVVKHWDASGVKPEPEETPQYLCRAPFKGKLLEDLKKANYYLTRAIAEMEEAE